MKSYLQFFFLLALVAMVLAAPVAQAPPASGGDPITGVLNEVIGLLTSLRGGLGGGGGSLLRAREAASA